MERIVAASVGFDLAATEAFGRDEVTPLSSACSMSGNLL
jgi:hypothetical protein